MTLDLLILAAAFLGSVLSGLFGGGAGLIFTPVIFFFLSSQNPHADNIMQTSITTMIASMLPSGLLACFKQHAYKQIDWEVLRWSAPPMIVGAILGCIFMVLIPSKILINFFAIATLVLAVRSGFKLYSQSSKTTPLCFNGSLFRCAGSFLLGLISTVSGSASFVLPFYERIGLSIKLAIGTTTVAVWLYSVFVIFIMMIFGLHQQDLPVGNISYLNYRCLWLFMIPTIPGAIVGARLSHCLSERKLKIMFVLLLIAIGSSMLFSS